MPDDLFLRALADDGLYLPSIKVHSLEKIKRHNYFARVFSSGMKAKWPQRAYIGLYSGAGRAKIDPTGEIIETTAMSVLRLPDPFTHYIFVDSDPRCVDALRTRSVSFSHGLSINVIQADVANIAPAVRSALPPFGRDRGLLSFCFVDPFAADINFDTIRQLSAYRMDFLVLLMLGWDARVNFQRYYNDRTSTRLADMIDCPTWRAEWDAANDRSVVRFLLRKFDEAMARLGYLTRRPDSAHRVTANGTGVMQYLLAFYSKSELGQKFWDETLRRSEPQLAFDFPA